MEIPLQHRQIYIADTIHKTVLLSAYEKEVISTQLFNRLHNISQNSTAYLTFPTNKTKRFEHSLGTMKLCGDMFYFSLVNNDSNTVSTFLEDFKKALSTYLIRDEHFTDKIRPIIGDTNLGKQKITKLKELKIQSVFYNIFVPQNIQNDNICIYLIAFQAVRLCALLHDLGHPPFSHITESAINDVYKEIKELGERNERQNYFYETLSEYELDKNSSQLHEIMGNKMVGALIKDLLYSGDSWSHALSLDEKYFKILVFETVKLIFLEKCPIFKFLHFFIDGVLDGDRFDYINRDLFNSGINSGSVEYDRIVSSLRIFKKNNEYFLASSAKTINTLEDFFFKRWGLYKGIIYHHRVIKTDTLLKNCIKNIMLKYLSDDAPEVDKEEVEEADSAKMKVLPYNISGLWTAIKIANSNTNYFHSLTQWDDAWLSTVLKKVYLEEYYNTKCETSLQLEELLSNKKNYFSIIKNSCDFQNLSKHFEDEFCKSKFYKLSEFEKIKNIIVGQSNGASIFYVVEAYFAAYDNQCGRFQYFIKKSAIEFINETYKTNVNSCIVEFRTLKTGLEKQEPSVYEGNELIDQLQTVSNIKGVLSSERFIFPYIHIYLCCEDKKAFSTRSYLIILLSKIRMQASCMKEKKFSILCRIVM